MKGLAEACCVLMLALPDLHRLGFCEGIGLHVLLIASAVCAWGGIESCAWGGQGLGGACHWAGGHGEAGGLRVCALMCTVWSRGWQGCSAATCTYLLIVCVRVLR